MNQDIVAISAARTAIGGFGGVLRDALMSKKLTSAQLSLLLIAPSFIAAVLMRLIVAQYPL